MDLYFLDEDFSLIDGPIDEFTSIVWSERFNEIGAFTIHFPRSLIGRVNSASYVRCAPADNGGRILCGRIEYLTTGDDGDCEMGGHLLEVLLCDRLMYGKGNYSGTVSGAAVSAVTDNLRNDALTPITVSSDSAEITEQITAGYEWETLSDWLYALLTPYGASYRIELDTDTMKPVFRIITGSDLTSEAIVDAQPAIFSSSFGNIVSIGLERQSEGMKNVVYVEGSDGTVVTLDRSGGGHIRETYKKASDIDPEDFSSTAAYKAALSVRASEVLAKLGGAVYVSAECDADALPRYGIDYHLGDICDIVDDELCLSFGMRLTAVDTVCEGGMKLIYPSFGDEVRYVRQILKNKN